METRVTEVADGIHQLSTFVGAPVGFNQYLITADEPLLFHTGMRQMFPLVSAGVSAFSGADQTTVRRNSRNARADSSVSNSRSTMT